MHTHVSSTAIGADGSRPPFGCSVSCSDDSRVVAGIVQCGPPFKRTSLFTCAQVRKVIWKLFKLMPTPEAAVAADVDAIRALIEPLGLAPKRAPMLKRFSQEYLQKQVL